MSNAVDDRVGISLVTNGNNGSVLQTANTALFRMSGLMGNVRTLSRQAGDLRETDTAGIASLRKQIGETLKQFDEVSKAAGGEAKSDQATTDKINTMNLRELRATLSDMQSNLKDNFLTVSSGIQKAIAYGSHYQETTPSGSAESLATLWERLYPKRSGSSYL